MNFPHLLHSVPTRVLLATLGLLFSGYKSIGQTIPNPSFETDTFTVAPGYSSVNTAITDWNTNFPANTGLNTSAGPFANNGTIPEGVNAAFIQNNLDSNLSTTISGLTPGVLYKVNFRANARGGNLPVLRFDTDGADDPVPMDAVISSVGGANPYRYVAYEFRATAATQVMTISNPNLLGGDNTVLIDDFTIAPSTGAWSYARWRDDASAGLSSGYYYTHAYTFGGSAVPTTVNGVGFRAAPGVNPTVAGSFTTTGYSNAYGDVGRNLPGASNALGKSFVYGAADMSISLQGLKPNTSYVATIYGVAFDLKAGYARSATFSTNLTPTDRLTVNLDHYDQANAIRVVCAYTSDANGTVTLNYSALGNGSWHTSGFSNREAVSSAWSEAPWRDDATSGINNSFTYTHAYNLGSADSPTINGVPFTGVAGVNPTTGNLTLQNFGAVGPPDGNNVTAAGGGSQTMASNFIYNGFPGIITLSGLAPGQSYLLSLFSVGWEATGRQAALLGTNGRMLVDQDLFGDNGGIRFDYYYVADATGSVTVTTNPTGAGSIHLYGLANRETTVYPASPWSTTQWDGNATSGVNSDAVYTHAYNFGVATNALINGVNFVGIAGANPSSTNFTTQNMPNTFQGDANNITGNGSAGAGSQTLSTDFVWGGNPGVLRLTDLIPGKEYLLSLFSVGWGPEGQRFQTFTAATGKGRLDQHAYGDNQGIRFDYRYIADATGTATITIAPENTSNTLHFCGFCNREFTFVPSLKVLTPPENVYVTALGASATFTVVADGPPALTYQWKKGTTVLADGANYSGVNTPTLTVIGVDPTDVGSYLVEITGGGGEGPISSTAAQLVLITDPVPGLFDTGMGNNCAVLADGQGDPHYLLLANPDGDSFIQAVVQDSTVFPIVGPWIDNTTTSKWIGPRFNTAQAGGQWIVPPNPTADPPVVGEPRDGGAGQGTYVYRTTFDLTGFDLNSVRITGSWASDNEGVAIKVNDVATGITSAGNFGAMTNFILSSANCTFVAGVNTVDFHIKNADVVAGYTGLRVENLKGFGAIPANTPPHIAVSPVDTAVPRNTVGCLMVSASGSATLTYQWYKDNALLPGETNSTLTALVNSPLYAGTYFVRVSNGIGAPKDSDPAIVTIPNFVPFPATDGFYTSKNTAGSIAVATLIANDTDGDTDPLTVTAVSPTSANGGTVTLSMGNVTYTPALDYVGPDTFTYTVNDGWGGVVNGTVQVAVLAGTIPKLGELDFSALPDKTKLRFVGIPGTSYTLESSLDLLDWPDISTVTAPPTGVLDFQVPVAVEPARFYRIRTNEPPVQ